MPWTLRMIMLLALVMLVILVYIGFRLYWSVKIVHPRHTRLFYGVLAAAITAFFIYPVVGFMQHSLGFDYNWESIPSVLVYPFWYGLVFSGVLLSWFITIDLIFLIGRRALKKRTPRYKILQANLLLIFAGVIAVYVGVKMVWDTHRIETTEIAYELNDANLEDFTIIHITDLQADRYTTGKKMERYVKKINEAQPDLVLFSGDLVTEGANSIIAGAEALSRIESRYGVFAVIGDHDYWAGHDHVVKELEERDITVLWDENYWLEHNGSRIKLTGLTEIYNQKTEPEILLDLLNEDEGSLNIMITHQATERLIKAAQDSNYHHLLAGHTHGGQIIVPFFFYQLSGARRDTQYINGIWWMNGMLFNISNGLGFTLGPVRYNAPANLSIIRIE